MRTFLFASLFVALQGLSACQDAGTATYHNALTGAACTPNGTLTPPAHGNSGGNGNGGQNSPTGIPGDNMDDLHSGKVDCYYDGNSGQGDDKKHPCAPGCDDQHCCSDDPGDDGSGSGGDDGSGSGGDDGSGSGSGSTDTNPI